MAALQPHSAYNFSMIGYFITAFLFGIVAGLRTFTGEAVYFGLRGGAAGIVFPIFAIVEYIGDALPRTPSRTGVGQVIVRLASGAFMGYVAARTPGSVLGILGALIGTFGGYRARMWMVARIGAIPAAIIEDLAAIALAFGCVELLSTSLSRAAGVPLQ